MIFISEMKKEFIIEFTGCNSQMHVEMNSRSSALKSITVDGKLLVNVFNPCQYDSAPEGADGGIGREMKIWHVFKERCWIIVFS